MTHQKIIDFIRTLRGSFHDSVLVYEFGGCYGLYQILKHLCPSARAYFAADNDHVVTKIQGTYYDIKGRYFDEDIGAPLTKTEHEKWAVVSAGQRLDVMLAKYQRHCNRVAKQDGK